jgi:integrase
MTVFKRRDSQFYYYDFWHAGRRYQGTTRLQGLRAAQDWERAYRVNLAREEVGIAKRPEPPNFEEFTKTFLDHVRSQAVAYPRTAEFYEDCTQRLLRFKPVKQARLDEIDERLIDRFCAHALRGLRPQTVNHSLRTLRKALYLAEEWKVILKAPRIKLLPGEREREFVLPAGKLRDKFFERLPEPAQSVALLLCETGLRIGELCALTWDRVSFDPLGDARRGYMFVNRGKSKNARRHIPLTENARKILKQQANLRRNQWVFPRVGKKVKPLDLDKPLSRHWVSEQFRTVKTELGLPWDCVLHSTRHTALTDLGAAGADAFTIQRWAGHSSVTISQKYVHPTPETMERAAERLEIFQRSMRTARKRPFGGVGKKVPEVVPEVKRGIL